MADSPQTSRKRFRWLTVGEVVGVLALVISGLSFWDSHQDRRNAQAARAAEARAEPAPIRLTRTATVDDGALVVAARPADAVIQRLTLVPPTGQGEPVATARARIEPDWIAAYARAQGVGATGEGAVPVAIITESLLNGAPRTDRAIYDIAYTLHDRLLASDRVELAGLAAVQVNLQGDPRKSLDALAAARAAKAEATNS